MPRTRTIILSTIALAIAIQLAPIDHDNPPATASVTAPAPVASILRRACYDCHSHETTWPWYSYVAPVSWLVARDVHEGRRHMDFSTWAPQAEETGRYLNHGTGGRNAAVVLSPDARQRAPESRRRQRTRNVGRQLHR
jgi:hypothetical protein